MCSGARHNESWVEQASLTSVMGVIQGGWLTFP
jgi:hypothetical protein